MLHVSLWLEWEWIRFGFNGCGQTLRYPPMWFSGIENLKRKIISHDTGHCVLNGRGIRVWGPLPSCDITWRQLILQHGTLKQTFFWLDGIWLAFHADSECTATRTLRSRCPARGVPNHPSSLSEEYLLIWGHTPETSQGARGFPERLDGGISHQQPPGRWIMGGAGGLFFREPTSPGSSDSLCLTGSPVVFWGVKGRPHCAYAVPYSFAYKRTQLHRSCEGSAPLPFTLDDLRTYRIELCDALCSPLGSRRSTWSWWLNPLGWMAVWGGDVDAWGWTACPSARSLFHQDSVRTSVSMLYLYWDG